MGRAPSLLGSLRQGWHLKFLSGTDFWSDDDDQSPAFVEVDALLADKSELSALKIPDPLSGGRMLDRVPAAALFKEKVGSELIIEGWVEGPCAMAANLRGINTLLLDFFDDPIVVKDYWRS